MLLYHPLIDHNMLDCVRYVQVAEDYLWTQMLNQKREQFIIWGTQPYMNLFSRSLPSIGSSRARSSQDG